MPYRVVFVYELMGLLSHTPLYQYWLFAPKTDTKAPGSRCKRIRKRKQTSWMFSCQGRPPYPEFLTRYFGAEGLVINTKSQFLKSSTTCTRQADRKTGTIRPRPKRQTFPVNKTIAIGLHGFRYG